MVDIAGTAEGRGDTTALVLVGDEVSDWALIESIRHSMLHRAHTPFANNIAKFVALREQAIRRAAQRRGRKAGGTNWSAAEWRAQRQWVEDVYQKEHHRRPRAHEVQQWLGLTPRTEQKYRRQWGVPGAWSPDEDEV